MGRMRWWRKTSILIDKTLYRLKKGAAWVKGLRLGRLGQLLRGEGREGGLCSLLCNACSHPVFNLTIYPVASLQHEQSGFLNLQYLACGLQKLQQNHQQSQTYSEPSCGESHRKVSVSNFAIKTSPDARHQANIFKSKDNQI